ncbi:MAG TPA: glycerate kinase [Actinocrinis sp.]|nr:glycerate kinase [Actinocrinis sp.]
MPTGRCRVLVAPDKFKGSLTAAEAAERLARGLRAARPDWPVRTLPVADGGDGTVDAAVSAGFDRRTATVPGPVGEPVPASFALRNEVAVVELAEAGGLRRLPRGEDPLGAHTRGTGALIAAALAAGAKTIVLGVGGSASTDAGTGLLTALGVRFVDNEGRPVADGGGHLHRIAAADLSGLDPRVRRTRFLLASDVDNPLLGPNGAAAVYGPQKGASPADVALLEAGLRNVVNVLGADATTAAAAADLPGAGAAGGAGYAALAVLGATRRSGIDLVLTTIGFDRALADADLVITGEGRLDAQTLRGKAPAGVARAAGARGLPVLAVCGQLDLSPQETAAAGFAAAYALTDLEPDPAKSIADAGPLLQRLGERIARDWSARTTSTPENS